MNIEQEEKINAEIRRLNRIFNKIDKNKKAVVLPLIETAAFYRVTLRELEVVLNQEGYVEQYKNGENQFGMKKRPEADLHIAVSKNLTAIIKQLTDLVPAEERKKSRLEALENG